MSIMSPNVPGCAAAGFEEEEPIRFLKLLYHGLRRDAAEENLCEAGY